MNSDVLIPIVIIIGCIILIVIYSISEEDFKEPDIILPTAFPQVISDYENKKDLIINNDGNNNFPLEEITIEPPRPSNVPIENDAAFKDVDFDKIRDKGVDNAMKNKSLNNDEEYKTVIDAALGFQYPKNSGDFLTNINVKNISKDELNNSTLADIFNRSTAKVIDHVSQEEFKRIQGTPIQDIKLETNLYKPEVVLMDKNLDTSNEINSDITYKYSGFDGLSFGSQY